VLVALFGVGNISSSQTYSSINRGNTQMTPGYTYPGPSNDYTTTPHARSLWANGVEKESSAATSRRWVPGVFQSLSPLTTWLDSSLISVAPRDGLLLPRWRT